MLLLLCTNDLRIAETNLRWKQALSPWLQLPSLLKANPSLINVPVTTVGKVSYQKKSSSGRSCISAMSRKKPPQNKKLGFQPFQTALAFMIYTRRVAICTVKRKNMIKELSPTVNFPCQDTEVVGFLGGYVYGFLSLKKQISI